MGRPIKKGLTDQSTTIRIIDSSTFLPETGVEHDTTGIALWYRRTLSAQVAITEAALAALTTAHADGGIEHIGDGYYRLDLPDAAVATGANEVTIGGTVTGMIVIGNTHPLVDYDPEDAINLGLTRLKTLGYAGAAIWFDSVGGAAGAVDGVNGTYENPCSSMADVLTLRAAKGIRDIAVKPGSTMTLPATALGACSVWGDSWILALADRDISGVSFSGCTVTGDCSGTAARFSNATLGAMELPAGSTCQDCAIAGTVALLVAGNYDFPGLRTEAGSTALINGNAITAATNLNIPDFNGVLTISGFGDANSAAVNIDGAGELTLGSGQSGMVARVHNPDIAVTNSGSATVTQTTISSASAIAAAIGARTISPVSAPITMSSSWDAVLAFLTALSGGQKVTQDADETNLRNEADDADVATAPTTNAGGVTSKGPWA